MKITCLAPASSRWWQYSVTLEEDPDGGDFGACSLHYVELVKEGEQIFVDDTKISIENQTITDLDWSSDGRYMVLSDIGRLKIQNFENKKEWITENILLKDEDGKVVDVLNSSGSIGITLLKWLDNDQKILFRWKEHPMYDESYLSEIEVAQFNLD